MLNSADQSPVSCLGLLAEGPIASRTKVCIDSLPPHCGWLLRKHRLTGRVWKRKSTESCQIHREPAQLGAHTEERRNTAHIDSPHAPCSTSLWAQAPALCTSPCFYVQLEGDGGLRPPWRRLQHRILIRHMAAHT